MKSVPRNPDDTVNVTRRNQVKEAALLLTVLTGVGLLIFSLLGGAVEIAVGWIPIETEAQLLAALSLDDLLDGADESHPDNARLTARLNELAAHWPDDPYEHRVLVMPTDEPNAFAVPGGLVMVTEGLIDIAEDEELDFVLAHELGHFHGRDHLASLGRSVVFGLVLSAAGLGSQSALLENTGLLTDRAYGRDQERAADAFALAVLYAEHDSIDGALSFLRKLPSEDGVSAIYSALVATHPGTTERVAHLCLMADQRGWR